MVIDGIMLPLVSAGISLVANSWKIASAPAISALVRPPITRCGTPLASVYVKSVV
jgi:hypothetical protein